MANGVRLKKNYLVVAVGFFSIALGAAVFLLALPNISLLVPFILIGGGFLIAVERRAPPLEQVAETPSARTQFLRRCSWALYVVAVLCAAIGSATLGEQYGVLVLWSAATLAALGFVAGVAAGFSTEK